MELEYNINGKNVKIRDIVKTLLDIKKIVEGDCNYCKRNNINKCEDKLKIIDKLINRLLGGDND